MANGANSIHLQLRTELENYIKSQYFGKTPLLLEAINEVIDNEGLLYQKPYIESSPAYKVIENGIEKANITKWLKLFFSKLSEARLGVYPSPFLHQITALERTCAGDDLFVSTGTGSGKTECFLWPLLAKLVTEAHDNPTTWDNRGVRTIIMYPMNALVSDQVSRLRRLIGDAENKFVSIFRETCGQDVRRPQFGMYTGRTPYPGFEPKSREDHKLEKTLERMTFPTTDMEKRFFKKLLAEGKVPAKKDMKSFLENLHDSNHVPNEEDAELITRFEMQQVCPDILITNYSMLEYMLLRPIESKIWKETKRWLESDDNNKLLFVIDEAHMYRGSAGGEVALLIRRLFRKLGITREQVQFILTTASMPNTTKEDENRVRSFAKDLTAATEQSTFCYLTGETEKLLTANIYNISFDKFNFCNVELLEMEESRLNALNLFWKDVDGSPAPFSSLDVAYKWMYSNLALYKPFYELIQICRGTAVSLKELAKAIFPEISEEKALNFVSILLAIAPLAKDSRGSVLFPARMHMLFRGIKGVYACTNANCPHSHTDGTITLGGVFLSDGHLVCPHCNSVVYELYNDRRCGALFYKGYILEDDIDVEKHSYLWRYPGQMMDRRMKEIHLFIPHTNFSPIKKKGKNNNPIKPCYLDVKSGFINFRDDSKADKPGIRKLYYCNYSVKGRPQIFTFPTCPHCNHLLSQTQLTSFSTRGNQSFYSLIQSQFQAQPAVFGKTNDPKHLPNEGRKVLLFSDSRQRAARLARDMSETSDISAARQLFALAINYMEKSTTEYSMNELYDYFCLAAAQKHVQIYHEPERKNFIKDCKNANDNYELSIKHGRAYRPRFNMSNAPLQMQAHLLRLFSGGYNTLYDSATCWIEPTTREMQDGMDMLDEGGYEVSQEIFLEVFNAWILSVCDTSTALGHTISDIVRMDVRRNYGGYGLDKSWSFSKIIKEVLGWKDNSEEAQVWTQVMEALFLVTAQPDNGRLYIDLSRIRPRFDPSHTWYKCEQCSEVTPFQLMHHCPSCGSTKIKQMTEYDVSALSFWRKPIDDALKGNRIHVIDTEEHTAQISHKDQRDNMWSRTELYELRFQDLIQEGETPVDILSSTTTMEVGIDIGSLVAVGMRNIPPMRENYQQRAGRAGRRGASLSTIVTFCEDGPHDSLYFRNPVPMFRGDPRSPWIDIHSEKLIQRHLNMIVLQDYLATIPASLDTLPAAHFLDKYFEEFEIYLTKYIQTESDVFRDIPERISLATFQKALSRDLFKLKEKREVHPELYGIKTNGEYDNAKTLLDALYEEGIVPTYSFPKNVVSTYISDDYGNIRYQVERGLDIAIGEYAPGRAIIVDKQTYQIGGLYYPGSERKGGQQNSPARTFIEDPNYIKNILTCKDCGWFGLEDDKVNTCPFCGNKTLYIDRQMLRPWGFAPRNAESIQEAQMTEEYTSVQQPLYSTLPEADGMHNIKGCKNIRIASRTNQRIIMLNKGKENNGFMVCKDCGAAFPGKEQKVLEDIQRPYKSKYARGRCKHSNSINANLGYDFITDMVVLEFSIDYNKIDTRTIENPWINRAAVSLAETLRIAASQELDIEFTELVTGYRIRKNVTGFYVDIYLYDSLSSGAGYCVSIARDINLLLKRMEEILTGCNCGDACHKCLKHYRNQYVHGMLDRISALQLLRWGSIGAMAEVISTSAQQSYIAALKNILDELGCDISFVGNDILVNKSNKRKSIVVYPAMWIEPNQSGTIFVSDAYVKLAKPYAVHKIVTEANF
jgi:ATP-dependent helicase YprA (DUF1998 family)/Zn finger protein HypA/HybF involved in hydrogenase expression